MPNEPEKTKVRAKDNPWYLLATLYGEQTPDYYDDDLINRNRTAWNRYMGRFLNEACRELAKGPHTAEAATPFTDEETSALEEDFARWHREAGSIANLAIPNPKEVGIDFANVEFGRFQADGFVFPAQTLFSLRSSS